MVIARLLEENTTLTTLDLSDNDLTAKAGAAIARALKRNRTLTTLDLSDNDLLMAEGGKAIASALHSNTTLTSLDLAGNHLGSEAEEELRQIADSRAWRRSTLRIEL